MFANCDFVPNFVFFSFDYPSLSIVCLTFRACAVPPQLHDGCGQRSAAVFGGGICLWITGQQGWRRCGR